MKSIKLITLLVFISFNTFSQKDYTFCNGSIAVSMLAGGKSLMVRYDNSGKIVSSVNGEFDLYGKGGPTETLKIKFQGTEYRYDLIRDGLGIPSIIIDNQGRKYTLCNVSKNSSSENSSSESTADILKKSFNSKDPKRFSTNFIVIGNLAISQYDVGYASWQDAMRACGEIGSGWHLPSLDELKYIYKYKGDIKLSTGKYWSSTQAKIKNERPWGVEFEDGAYTLEPYDGSSEIGAFISNSGSTPHIFMNNVRAVKVLSKSELDEYNKNQKIKADAFASENQEFNSKENSKYVYFYRTGEYIFSGFELFLLDFSEKGLYASASDGINVKITTDVINITKKGKSIIVPKDWKNGGWWKKNEKFVDFENNEYLIKFYFIKGLRKANPNAEPIKESDNISENNNNDFAIDKNKIHYFGDMREYKALPRNAELQIINKLTGETSKVFFLTCKTQKFSRQE